MSTARLERRAFDRIAGEVAADPRCEMVNRILRRRVEVLGEIATDLGHGGLVRRERRNTEQDSIQERQPEALGLAGVQEQVRVRAQGNKDVFVYVLKMNYPRIVKSDVKSVV